jgi:LmbE family N-acetylglucosaminyl deacetylase
VELRRLDVRGRVAIVSPHLDDAVLSLGAAIAAWGGEGVEVRVVTVLAGNPDSAAPARPWDRSVGFMTAGEAARARREEDRLACEIIGATPVWLPFGAVENERGGEDAEIWDALAQAVAGANIMLVPGFPLTQVDHAWLARLILERELLTDRIGLYVEQPYAYWQVVSPGLPSTVRRLGGFVLRTRNIRRRQTPFLDDRLAGVLSAPPLWTACPAGHRARRAKRRALTAYRSQISRLGRWLPLRITAYEWSWGGEGIGWLDPVAADSRLYSLRQEAAGDRALAASPDRTDVRPQWG